MTSTLRLYSFTHVYMSSIQHGIQTGHAMGEMFNKYVFDDFDSTEEQLKMVKEWNQSHKTWVALDGGNSRSLHEIYLFLEAIPIHFKGVDLPWAEFREDEDSMEGMRTAIAILVPEEIYKAVPYRTAKMWYDGDTSALRIFQTQYPPQTHGDDWFYLDEVTNDLTHYSNDTPIGQFLTMMKRCKLAS